MLPYSVEELELRALRYPYYTIDNEFKIYTQRRAGLGLLKNNSMLRRIKVRKA